MNEFDKLIARLEQSPYGDDKIDELTVVLKMSKFQIAVLQKKLEEEINKNNEMKEIVQKSYDIILNMSKLLAQAEICVEQTELYIPETLENLLLLEYIKEWKNQTHKAFEGKI